MTPLKLSPLERIQLTALAGALGHGLSGSTGYSLFGDVTSEIQDRQTAAQALAYKRQQDALDAQQALLGLQQKGVSSIQDLIASAAPDVTTTSYSATTDSLGRPVPAHTTTASKGGIPYQQLVAEIGALAGTTPGLTKQQLGAFGAAADAVYQMPALSGRDELNLLKGTGLHPNIQPYWKSIQRSVGTAISKNVPPDQIKKTVINAAANSGYGSPDEVASINRFVSELLAARGYPSKGPAGSAPVAPAAAQDGGGGLGLDPLAAIVGALGISGGIRGVQALRARAGNPLTSGAGGKGLQGAVRGYSGQGYAGRPGAAPADAAPPEVVPAGENPFYTRPEGHLPLGLPAGGAQPALGPGESTITPQMLGEGPPLTPQVLSEGQPLENTFPGLRGGSPLEGTLGALGSLALPLQAADAWAQQRNQTNLSQTWYGWTDAQRRQYMADHPEAFHPQDQLLPDGTVALSDGSGRIIDPVTKQQVATAG